MSVPVFPDEVIVIRAFRQQFPVTNSEMAILSKIIGRCEGLQAALNQVRQAAIQADAEMQEAVRQLAAKNGEHNLPQDYRVHIEFEEGWMVITDKDNDPSH